MSWRYRIAAIAFGLAINLVASGQAQEKAQSEQRQADQRDAPPDYSSAPIRNKIVEGEAEAEARKRNEAISRQHDVDDLKAQQGMDAATQRMAEYAYIANWIVGVGTGLLIITLFLNWGANRAATKAAMIAEKHLFASERPWIELISIQTDGPLIFLDNSAGESGQINLVMHIRNVGKSPAIRIQFDTKLTISNLEHLLT